MQCTTSLLESFVMILMMRLRRVCPSSIATQSTWDSGIDISSLPNAIVLVGLLIRGAYFNRETRYLMGGWCCSIFLPGRSPISVSHVETRGPPSVPVHSESDVHCGEFQPWVCEHRRGRAEKRETWRSWVHEFMPTMWTGVHVCACSCLPSCYPIFIVWVNFRYVRGAQVPRCLKSCASPSLD